MGLFLCLWAESRIQVCLEPRSTAGVRGPLRPTQARVT